MPGVGEQFADQPDQCVNVVVDGAGPGGGVEHPGLDIGGQRVFAVFAQ
ncbi:MAG TPA: hypothetical protein VGX25_25005 [Actinophytocola sp.]|nr:hypothetical protein [Actinophytocola sp.]HEV2782664.1 hypothetical protein [Actinophytocola sp.]